MKFESCTLCNDSTVVCLKPSGSDFPASKVFVKPNFFVTCKAKELSVKIRNVGTFLAVNACAIAMFLSFKSAFSIFAFASANALSISANTFLPSSSFPTAFAICLNVSVISAK
ncbi:Uncharacterised protein [Streptococcus pneumoniae]|nr:Uncharacterised protein [Streptococcus pneumoniae]